MTSCWFLKCFSPLVSSTITDHSDTGFCLDRNLEYSHVALLHMSELHTPPLRLNPVTLWRKLILAVCICSHYPKLRTIGGCVLFSPQLSGTLPHYLWSNSAHKRMSGLIRVQGTQASAVSHPRYPKGHAKKPSPSPQNTELNAKSDKPSSNFINIKNWSIVPWARWNWHCSLQMRNAVIGKILLSGTVEVTFPGRPSSVTRW